jgi:hypothetical protein
LNRRDICSAGLTIQKVYLGAAIIAGAGLFVNWRERQLGLQRARAAEGPPTGT